MTQHERFAGARVVPEYEVDTLGAPFKVTLLNVVTLTIDTRTGEEKVKIPNLVGLTKAVVRERVIHSRKLNGEEVRFIRNALEIKANKVAEFLDMSAEHLSRCEAGTRAMSTTSEKMFRLFAFMATFFRDPGEILDRALNETEIERKAKKPNEMGKKLAEQFLSMKIQSVFDPDEELHFVFTRVHSEDDLFEPKADDAEQWKSEEKMVRSIPGWPDSGSAPYCRNPMEFVHQHEARDGLRNLGFAALEALRLAQRNAQQPAKGVVGISEPLADSGVLRGR